MKKILLTLTLIIGACVLVFGTVKKAAAEETTPETTTPGETAAEETTPEATTPGETAAEETTPEATTPGEETTLLNRDDYYLAHVEWYFSIENSDYFLPESVPDLENLNNRVLPEKLENLKFVLGNSIEEQQKAIERISLIIMNDRDDYYDGTDIINDIEYDVYVISILQTYTIEKTELCTTNLYFYYPTEETENLEYIIVEDENSIIDINYQEINGRHIFYDRKNSSNDIIFSINYQKHLAAFNLDETLVFLSPNFVPAALEEFWTSARFLSEKDENLPKITGLDMYKVTNKSQLSVDTILHSLTSDGNYVPDFLELKLIKDTYTENYDSLGKYSMVFELEDLNEYKTTFSVQIEVVDGVAPVFYDINGVEVTLTKVHKSPGAIMLINDIKALLTVSDDVDGDIDLKDVKVIKDEYSGHGDEEGSYKIVLKAEDSSGNISTHTITVTVTELLPSKVYVANKQVVYITCDMILSNNDFIKIFEALGYYSDLTTTYIDLNSEAYVESANVVGVYPVSAVLTTTAGEQEEVDLIISVTDSRLSEGTLVKKPTNIIVRIFESIFNFIKTIVNWIFKLFTGKLF